MMAAVVDTVWQTLGVVLAVGLGGLGMSLAATVAFALLTLCRMMWKDGWR